MEDIKLKLSALWIALMFFYTYADILGFYAPGHLVALMAGEIDGIQITQAFLLMSAVLMAIPSLMIFLSLTLRVKVNRWINFSTGVILTLLLVATFFGEIPPYYLLYGVVEGVLLVLIIVNAWKWKIQKE